MRAITGPGPMRLALLGAVVVGIIATVGIPLTTRAGATTGSAPPLPVTVANTPLPVTGVVGLQNGTMVGISGTPAVSQSGTWNVGVNGPVTTLPALPSTAFSLSVF